MPAPSHKRITAFVVAMAILIVTPLAVVAADAFSDVPNTNVHHDDITWLRDNGVTFGCNPPANTEFCPGEPVLRQQMASFMRRLAENEVVNADTANEADHAAVADMLGDMEAADLQTGAVGRSISDESSIAMVGFPNYTEVADLQITVPEASGILLSYSVSTQYAGADEPYRVGISDTGDCTSVDVNTHAYGAVTSTDDFDSAAGTSVVEAAAGTHTFTLCAQTGGGGGVSINGASISAVSVGDAVVLSVLETAGSGAPNGAFGD